MPYPMFEQLRRQQHSFSDISALHFDQVIMQDAEGTLRNYDTALVSGNAFPLLDMTPYLGRLLAPADDVHGGPSVGWPAVLSYALWNGRFGVDPRIIGKQIKLSNIPVTVVGVTPPDFHGVWPGDDVKLYLPIQFATALAGKGDLNTADSPYFAAAIGRLRPGVNVRAANAEMALYQKDLLRQFIPAQYQRPAFFEKTSLRVESARNGLPTYFGRVYSEPLFIMQGLVIIVLVLCCVNVGGLMISKVYAR